MQTIEMARQLKRCGLPLANDYIDNDRRLR